MAKAPLTKKTTARKTSTKAVATTKRATPAKRVRKRSTTSGATPAASLPRMAGMQVLSAEQMLSILNAGDDYDTAAHHKLSGEEARGMMRRWQYVAATAIAEAMMLVDYEVQTIVEKKWAEDVGHPLSALLRRPNQWLTARELLYYLGLDLCILGESYWNVIRDSAGQPVEIWPVVGTVKPKRDRADFLTGYTATVHTDKGPRKIPFEVEDIVPFKLPQSGDLYSGFGPMMAAGGSVKVDDELMKSQYHAFKQGIFPFAIMYMDIDDPKERADLMQKFGDKYRGSAKSGEPIGLHQSMKLEFPAHTPKEMAFWQSADKLRDSILGMFRVPSVLAGQTRDVQNRATAEAAEYTFAKWNIRPKLALVENRINQDLCGRYYVDDVRVKFYSPIPADVTAEREDRKVNLATGVTTINEERAKQGLESVPWGDEPWLPSGKSQPSMIATEAQKAQTPKRAARTPAVVRPNVELDTIDRPDVTPPATRRQRRQRGRTASERRVIMLQWANKRRQLRKGYEKVWRRIFTLLEVDFMKAFDKMRKTWPGEQSGASLDTFLTFESATIFVESVIEAVGMFTPHVSFEYEPPYEANLSLRERASAWLRLAGPVDEVLDEERVARMMRDNTKPFVSRGIVVGGAFNGDVVKTPGRSRWGASDAHARRYIGLYTDPEYYNGMAAVTRARMSALMAEGLAQRATFDEMRARFAHEWAGMKESRAARITVTETTKLMNAGGQAFRESFGIEQKEWLCSFVNSRDTHIRADEGEPIPNDDMYNVGNDRMPAPGMGSNPAENVNCNCVSVAFVERS